MSETGNGSRRIDRFVPPLPRDMRERWNFFELYPFDGGGNFIQHDLTGALDDRRIVENILSGGALDEFGALPDLDFTRFERWNAIEKSCWINRMYFLVPLSRIAAVDRRPELAALVRDILLGFIRRYPGPATAREARALHDSVMERRDRDYNSGGFDFDAPVPYQWFDFQPASRLINLLNALDFLRDAAEVSAADWEEIDEFLRRNADTICAVEREGNPILSNHQALRGLALLYAACYFRGESGASDYLETGIRLVNHHLERDFLSDGMLYDLSFSYHVFESWIGRDARLLSRQYGFVLSPAAERQLELAFNLCADCVRPDGRMAVINDGYALDAAAFLGSIGRRRNGGTIRKFVLPEAGIAGYASNRVWMMLDNTTVLIPFAHYHAGKNGLQLWFDGCPFLVDSGCCSYDDPDFSHYFKQAFAHTSLLVDGTGDGGISGRYDWSYSAETRMSGWNNRKISGTVKADGGAWRGVRWTRTVEVGTDFTVTDEISSAETHRYEFVFILHPEVRPEIRTDCVELESGGVRKLLYWSAPTPVKWRLEHGLHCDGTGKTPCHRLVAAMTAADLRWTTRWRETVSSSPGTFSENSR